MSAGTTDGGQAALIREHQAILRMERAADSVEERLALIEDEKAIYDVLVAYCVHYDAGDVEALREVFAEDAVLINLRGSFNGIEEILENYVFITDFLSGYLHCTTNVTVRRDTPTTARASSYLYSLAIRERDSMMYGTGGMYSDRLEKRDGHWKIVERRVTGDLTHRLTPLPTNYDRFADEE